MPYEQSQEMTPSYWIKPEGSHQPRPWIIEFTLRSKQISEAKKDNQAHFHIQEFWVDVSVDLSF